MSGKLPEGYCVQKACANCRYCAHEDDQYFCDRAPAPALEVPQGKISSELLAWLNEQVKILENWNEDEVEPNGICPLHEE